MKIKKGDTVKVITGKDRGKVSKVVAVLPKLRKVVVEHVSIVTKFEKKGKGQKQKSGGIIKVEAPIDASNVMVISPKSSQPTRVGYKVINNKKVRISRKDDSALD